MTKFEILAEGFTFLEAPRWRDGLLWMSDMFGEAIYKVTPTGSASRVASMLGRPSGLCFAPSGALIAVSMRDRKLYTVNEDGEQSVYADLSELSASDLNDCVIDQIGNIYVGNFGYDLAAGEPPQPTNLFRVAPNGDIDSVAERLDFPNGCVITPDGETLICAETNGHRLTAFTRNKDGALSERRVWADLRSHRPDGICLDAAGAIWVASLETGEFLRVTEGGQQVKTIKSRSRHAIACALGGQDGRTLFALTYDGKLADVMSGAKRARIEICDVDTPAAGSP
ncbi:MAG: SMP-30/gluconolactonase/LRE family protein [Pseudomonadota bacterium]